VIRPNYAEIDLSNLTHNITSIKRSLVPGTKFLAVIKANAYGHGIVQISNAALRCADKGYVLETGRITMQGTGHELLNDQRVKDAYLGASAK